MPLELLRLGEVRQDAVINAAVNMPSNSPTPAGIGNTESTLSAPDQFDECYACVGESFSAFGSNLYVLLLSIRDWLKSWFVLPPRNNATRVDSGQVTPSVDHPEPNLPVDTPEPNPPVDNPEPDLTVDIPEPNPPVDTPEPNLPIANPEPNLPIDIPEPTPELILQAFGDEVRFMLPMVFAFFEILRDFDVGQADIEAGREEIGAHLVAIFDTFPEMVQLYIQKRMEELKKEENPGVVLVDNWAHRVIRGEVQYPDEAEPITTIEEMDILDENHLFNRAVADLLQNLGGPNPEELEWTLRLLKGLVHMTNLILFLTQNQPNFPAWVQQERERVVGCFATLPQELQNQVKARMVEIADPENPEVGQIPDWADRVILGQVQVPGEVENRATIERHVNILNPGSLFLRAIDDVINAAPVPEPAHV